MEENKTEENNNKISIDEFKKVEIRVGEVKYAEIVPGADKLLRLEVDFGKISTSEIATNDTKSLEAESSGNESSANESDEGKSLANESDDTKLPTNEIRQIVSGIREFFSPEQIIGKKFPFVTNLMPRTIKGLESNGMIMAARDDENNFSLLDVHTNVKNGTRLS